MSKLADRSTKRKNMMYTPVKVSVFTNQHDKLKNDIAQERATSIRLNLTAGTTGDGGDAAEVHTLLLTRGQLAKIERARLIGKRKATIRLSKRQMLANVKHQGGFLAMLGGLAAKALPTLLKGLAGGLVSGAVKKAVGGDGLYLHKSGHCVKVEPVQGNGLYLTPHRSGSCLPGVDGDGLYLKRGSTIHDGSGLILGPNSPFKNIPILNLLL